MANIPHIVYATDDNFAEILGVSLVSLYENSKDVDDIIVYVLDSGISDENIEKLKSLPQKYGRSDLSFIKATNISKELSMSVNLDRGSSSQYARLFVSSVLPAELDRVLYLDCDIIINKSISELWNLDIKGKTIAALKDAFSKQYRKNIDLDPDDVMFNSGVMLIDLDKWRRENVESKLLEFIRKKNGKIQQGDQGALNAILSKETFCLEPRFNSVTIFYDFSYEEMMVYRKPVDFYPREEIELAVREPSIIHYTTSFLSKRPWYEGCEHRYVAEWFKYKDISPWSDKPLWTEKKKNVIKGLYVSLCNKMPRKLMIGFSGILQAYGRPLVYKFK